MDIEFRTNVQNTNKEASFALFKIEISSYTKVLVTYAKILLYIFTFIFHGLPFSILAPLFTRLIFERTENFL